MVLKIIGAIILLITWLNDQSGIRKTVVGALHMEKTLSKLEAEKVEDTRVELYKTLDYVCIALFWIFTKYITFIVPVIILLNFLVYIRHLRYPDRIHGYSKEAKQVSTFARMLIASGICLAILTISTLQVKSRFLILVSTLTVILFGILLVRCLKYTDKPLRLIPIIIPVIFYAVGCIASVNSFYGVRTIEKVETVVEQIHSGNRTTGISIPEVDEVDGETYFSASIKGVEVGDTVKLVEREGCLGIRWFTVQIERN